MPDTRATSDDDWNKAAAHTFSRGEYVNKFHRSIARAKYKNVTWNCYSIFLVWPGGGHCTIISVLSGLRFFVPVAAEMQIQLQRYFI